MALLDADCGNLEQLAADCRNRGAGLGTAAAPESFGKGWQLTAAAVTSANVGVMRASQTMAKRMQDTAADLTTTAEQYAINDERSAAGLRALIREA